MWPVLAAPSAGPVPTLSEALGEPGRSVHHDQELQFGGRPRAPLPARGTRLPMPTAGPDIRVYGYLAYWDDDLASLPWDDLTDVAIFRAAADASGNLSETGYWDIADDAVAMAQPYGVRIHLCVALFDPGSIQSLLQSSTARNHLISELQRWESQTGADGINVDFEGLPAAAKTQMVQFVADLDAAVGDVVLATPAVDWNGSWDYDQLNLHADMFIMGYDYFWTGSSYAGPSDPLGAGAGTVWNGVNSYSLQWTVNDYLQWGGNPDRILLGLPLYGREWPTNDNNVPTRTTGQGSAVVFSDAWALGAGTYEADSAARYLRSGGQQLWFGDEDTVRERIVYARDDAGLAGVGFWALHYDGDDASFWNMVHQEARSGADQPTGPTDTGTGPGPTDTGDPGPTDTGTDPGPGPAGLVANAGLPFLAYVGDTVRLSAEGSRGPAGVDLQYDWTQVEGPKVTLDDPSAETPSFVVAEPGTVEFELRVGDGDGWSAASPSWVVVIDPGLPERHDTGCGCASADPTAALAPAAALAVLLGYRSRRRRRTVEVGPSTRRE